MLREETIVCVMISKLQCTNPLNSYTLWALSETETSLTSLTQPTPTFRIKHCLPSSCDTESDL